jgi:hypothetical protein
MRKFFFRAVALLFGCLLASIAFMPALRHKSRLTHEGKPIEYWEKQALLPRGQGSDKMFEATILPAMRKMGPEVVPFWLERMQTKDSRLSRLYSRLYSILPARLTAMLPAPIPQYARRNVAYSILSQLHLTNGTPELIDLTYSKDSELQFYAVDVLWWRAYRGLEPSKECIAAFCAALRIGNTRTRLSAVQGLNTLPVWPEALPALQLALEDPEEEIRVKAAAAILKLKPDCALQHIFQTGLTSSNHNARVISEVELSNLRRRQETRQDFR